MPLLPPTEIPRELINRIECAALDQAFGSNGVTEVAISINDLALSIDGSIIVAGASSDQFAIERLWISPEFGCY